MRRMTLPFGRVAQHPLLCLLVVLSPSLLPAHAQTTEEQTLAGLVPKIKFACASDVILGRKTSSFAGYPEYEHQMRELANSSLRFENLLPLLQHSDPKMRTLAIIALFDQGDPKMLPAVVALAGDHSPTYPCPQPLSLTLGMTVDPWPMTDQQVGQMASAVVNAYLNAAAFNYGIERTPNYPGFEGYWATHKNRPYSASWFEVRTNLDGVVNIKTVRDEIAALPEPDRQWELLWIATRHLYAGDEPSLVAPDAELLEACKRLGRDRLLQMLAGHVASTDPDLQPRYNQDSPYKHMMLFVLRHSDQLLKPEDAAVLLRRQDENLGLTPGGVADPFQSPWWAIGAAQLDPQHASEILHSAMAHFQEKYQGHDRARLALALWRLAGPSETRFVLDWFYEEPPCCGTTPRDEFLASAATLPHGRQLLASLVRDPRFDQVDWSSLDQLASILVAWTNPPVIGEQRRDAHYPDTADRFASSREELEKKYPKETADLLNLLAQWRAKIRTSLPAWSQK
jgi:hypothetical protein